MEDNGSSRLAGGAGMVLRVAEVIAGDLRQRILRRSLSDGPLPTQDVLAAEYGVSGPSVREALRILEAEGLITVRRGKLGGAYVHRPDWSSMAFAFAMSLQGQAVTLADLADTVLVLEPMCAVACASREDRLETVVPALRANLKETENAIGDGARYTRIARSFHDILVDHVPNQTMRLIVRSTVAVWSVQEQMMASMLDQEGHYPPEADQMASLRTHHKLVSLIDKADTAAVSALASAHLRATQRVMLDQYGDRVVDSSSPVAVQYLRSL